MIKFLHLTYHFEYSEPIEEILDKHNIKDYVRIPMMEAKDCDGKHFGTQVYPGNSSVVQAQVEEDILPDLLKDLREFRDLKSSRRHLQALVLPVEQKL